MKRTPSLRVAGTPVHSVHDAAIAMLEEALALLGAHHDDESVHAARKLTKRLRAALRLMRTSLGQSAYQRANRGVRDAARPLRSVRDGFVLLGALGGLRQRGETSRAKMYAAALRRMLSAEHRALRQKLGATGVRGAMANFEAVRHRLQSLPAQEPDTTSAVKGVKKVYKSGRSAQRQVRARGGDTALHEWRKQAKYLLNALDLLQSVFGAKFKKVRGRAHRLAELLGDDHDLAVLGAHIRRLHARIRSPAKGEARSLLEKRIKKRRRALQAEARPLGEQLYAHPARRIEHHIAQGLSVGRS